MSDDENKDGENKDGTEEKKADVIQLQVLAGGKTEEGSKEIDWNMWMRAKLMALLADPKVNFENAALVARHPTGTQLLCTRGLMPGVAELNWGIHYFLKSTESGTNLLK